MPISGAALGIPAPFLKAKIIVACHPAIPYAQVMEAEVASLDLSFAQQGTGRDFSKPYPSHPLSGFKMADVLEAQKKPEGWIDDDEDRKAGL